MNVSLIHLFGFENIVTKLPEIINICKQQVSFNDIKIRVSNHRHVVQLELMSKIFQRVRVAWTTVVQIKKEKSIGPSFNHQPNNNIQHKGNN